MTSKQYRAMLEALALTQGDAAEFLGVSIRTSNGWANNTTPIPVAVDKLLRLSVHLRQHDVPVPAPLRVARVA